MWLNVSELWTQWIWYWKWTWKWTDKLFLLSVHLSRGGGLFRRCLPTRYQGHRRQDSPLVGAKSGHAAEGLLRQERRPFLQVSWRSDDTGSVPYDISAKLRVSPVRIREQALGPLRADKSYWCNDNTSWPTGTVSEKHRCVERLVPPCDWQWQAPQVFLLPSWFPPPPLTHTHAPI